MKVRTIICTKLTKDTEIEHMLLEIRNLPIYFSQESNIVHGEATEQLWFMLSEILISLRNDRRVAA